MRNNIILTSLFLFASMLAKGQEIKPIYPIPSAKQIAWQELRYYGFVHFNMNTFTNVEWGEGKEDPKLFNPTQLDCNQWAQNTLV